MRTIALLPALVGAFDKPGGGITRMLGGAPSDLSRLIRSDLRPSGTRTVNMVELGNALTKLDDPPIKLLYVYLSSFLEVTDIYWAYGHNYIQIAHPVISPVGQSRSILAIFQDLADRLSFNDDVFSLDVMEFVLRLLPG